MTFPTRAALRITLIYGVAGVSWILFSDRLLGPVFDLAPLGISATWWQSVKGLFFVSVTSVLLYVLLYRQFGHMTDILDRYRESEQRWQRLLNQTPEPVLILDETRILYSNEAALKILGVDQKRDIINRDLREILADGAEEVVAHKPSAEDPHVTSASGCYITDRQGNVRCIDIHSSVISFSGKECLLSVWRDETKRQEYQQELVAARNEAVNASRMKTTILANLSHEIRTPLTAIIGFADILNQDPEAPVTESVDLIHRSGLRLKETLESILTLAELESGRTGYQSRLLDVRDIVGKTAEIFSGEAGRKNLDLRVNLPEEPVHAYADPTAVAQIVMNLVSNALKFTNEGGVSIVVDARNEGAVLEVSDTGIGIDPQYLPMIFDEFVQVSQGLDRKYEGSGLGLTIVRQLVELHSGSIGITSRDGDGTRITVTLPTDPVDTAHSLPSTKR